MVVYYDTIRGGTPENCQEFNLNIPSLLLEEAAGDGKPFVLLSRAEVFNMSDFLIYKETSPTNPVCNAGKMLSIMENKVLEYKDGYVIRTSHVVSDIIEDIKDIVSDMPTSVRPTVVRPVSMEVVNHIVSLVVHGNWKDRKKIIHVPMPDVIPLATIVYRLYGGEADFEVDDGGRSISEDYLSALDSAVFSEVFGADEMIRCIYANKVLAHNEIFGV